MNHDRPNLDQLLELASSGEDKARLARVWRELESVSVEEPPRAMTKDFSRVLRAFKVLPPSTGISWARAAAIFGIGLLTGALGISVATRQGTGPSPDAASQHAAAIVAALPLRTAAQRLAAMHVVGCLAHVEPAAQAALIHRVLRDPTPAVQLAAVGHLADLELSTSGSTKLAT